jgi:hypothetical protein
MTDKAIIDEIRGTVLKINENTIADGKLVKELIIKPDIPEYEPFPENLLDREYPDFSVGQRVVQVVYTFNRPATEEDIKAYEKMNLECPKEIEEFEYITYDEATYDNEIKQLKN